MLIILLIILLYIYEYTHTGEEQRLGGLFVLLIELLVLKERRDEKTLKTHLTFC